MLYITTKDQYFKYLDEGYGSPNKQVNSMLKGIQDASILYEISKSNGLAIADIGGGDSRIFNKLKESNRCYIIDRFEGVGSGPIKVIEIPGVTSIVSAMGEFSKDVPEDYFDAMVSISVLEHVPNNGVTPYFQDIARCLKSGGRTFHAVDLFIGDNENRGSRDRIAAIISAVEKSGLKWLGKNLLDSKVVFRSSFASMSDAELWRMCREWWKTPDAEKRVKESQFVNLMVGCYKP